MPDSRPSFRGGCDIALKMPARRCEARAAFYREMLGLPHLKSLERDAFEFGAPTRSVDLVDAVLADRFDGFWTSPWPGAG